MIPVVTAKEMRESEKRLFDTGISSLSLMERAAGRLTEELVSLLNDTEKTVIFACGAGGNGGDGYAAARLFTQKGGRAIALEVYPPKTEDAKKMRALAEGNVFAVTGMDALSSLPTPHAWVDCVFGTGLERDVDEKTCSLIQRIASDREKGALVVSADIPSGLHADTGRIMGACVEADCTVTFQWMKRGHLIGSGPDVTGEIRVSDIGLSERYLDERHALLIQRKDVLEMLPIRKRTSHKNDFGHVIVVAGSFGMAGAGAMCAKAAYRTGAGLVTIACIERLVPVYQMLVPEAMCIPLPEENGMISDEALETVNSALKGKSAVVFGPGIGRGASVKVAKCILESGLPAVIDADAINIISERNDLKVLLNENHALTPHPGEARRLIGELSHDDGRNVLMLNDFGAYALLKGTTTLFVKDGNILLSASGNCGMAKGGSGDVLSGMVGALMANGVKVNDALWMASELHGIAGDIAKVKKGEISMLPTDIIDCIGDAYESLSNA